MKEPKIPINDGCTEMQALGKPLPPLPAATAGEPFFKSLKDFYSGDIVVEAGYGASPASAPCKPGLSPLH